MLKFGAGVLARASKEQRARTLLLHRRIYSDMLVVTASPARTALKIDQLIRRPLDGMPPAYDSMHWYFKNDKPLEYYRLGCLGNRLNRPRCPTAAPYAKGHLLRHL
jgi:hypothetical protein